MMDNRRLMMQRYANYAYQAGEKVVQLRTSIYWQRRSSRASMCPINYVKLSP